MELILLDERLRAYAVSRDFDLDMAIGEDENDFQLTCGDAEPVPRGYVLIDGTEYGGVIDRCVLKVEGRASTATYSGRTWHGILDSKVIEPDPGQSHLAVSGDANAVLASLVTRLGLGELFAARAEKSGIGVSYTFERYTSGYLGIRKMLLSSGAKLRAAFDGSRVVLGAERCGDYRDEVDSDLLDFTVTSEHSAVNHLIGLGGGEGAARAVCHWYADGKGAVSQSQTLFGLEERTAVYDYNNASDEELRVETRKKLEELQGQGSVSVDVRGGLEMDVGDTVSGRDNSTGTEVAARIVKKIASADGGGITVDYEVGTEKASRSLTGSAESSGGAPAYSAGRGLKLEGYTFSAEVAGEDLAAVESKAAEAVRTAAGKSDIGHTHPWADVTGRPTAFPPLSHTHPYAGASSAGGAATSALKLSTARTITLTGAVSGSASFDGSRNVTISTTGGGAAESPELLYQNDYWRVVRHGGACTVFARNIVTGSGPWDALDCRYTVPANLRPAVECLAACVTQSGDSGAGFIRVKPDGTISVGQLGSAGTSQPRYGQLTWIPGM